MRFATKAIPCVAVAVLIVIAPAASAMDTANPYVHAGFLWDKGYDGTGVEIGVLDAYLADSSHPAISGNYLGSIKFALGASSLGSHATQVVGAAVGADATYPGIAPGAGWWTGQTARAPQQTSDQRTQTIAAETFGQGLDELAGNPVEVITLSIGFDGDTNAADQWSLALDHVVGTNGRTVTVAAGNSGPASGTLDGYPSAAYNAIIVGATGQTYGTPDYSQVASYSSRGPSDDGRVKPDMVAPGSQLYLPDVNGGWESVNGTSFATPIVAGGAALLTDMGIDRGLSTDPRVIKSVLLNSADKLAGWSHTPSQPLDLNQGAGEMNLSKAFGQYLLGEQDAGTVRSVGWDMGAANAVAEQLYHIDTSVPANTPFSATLVWNRNVTSSSEDIESAVYSAEPLRNLDLVLYDADDLSTPIASSVSTLDNVEHLYLTAAERTHYVLGVRMTGGTPADLEDYALAWHTLHDEDAILRTGDADLDGDVDYGENPITQPGSDGVSDLNRLIANAGTTSGAEWTDGDFDSDGDVDYGENPITQPGSDGVSDLNLLIANVSSSPAVGADQASGVAQMVYNEVTGEVLLDHGGGIANMTIYTIAGGIDPNDVDPFFSTDPTDAQNNQLVFFDANGLATGEDSIGACLLPGLDPGSEVLLYYQATGGSVTPGVITVVPEPATTVLLGLGGAAALIRRKK